MISRGGRRPRSRGRRRAIPSQLTVDEAVTVVAQQLLTTAKQELENCPSGTRTQLEMPEGVNDMTLLAALMQLPSEEVSVVSIHDDVVTFRRA